MFLFLCLAVAKLCGDFQSHTTSTPKKILQTISAIPEVSQIPEMLSTPSVNGVLLKYDSNITEDDIIDYSMTVTMEECEQWYRENVDYSTDASLDAMFVSCVFANAGEARQKNDVACAGLPGARVRPIYEQALAERAVLSREYMRKGDVAIIDSSISLCKNPDRIGIVTSVGYERVACVVEGGRSETEFDLRQIVGVIRPYYLRDNHLGSFAAVGTAWANIEDGYTEEGVRNGV